MADETIQFTIQKLQERRAARMARELFLLDSLRDIVSHGVPECHVEDGPHSLYCIGTLAVFLRVTKTPSGVETADDSWVLSRGDDELSGAPIEVIRAAGALAPALMEKIAQALRLELDSAT